MNPDNYASLEASRRLDEAGIVIETEFYWREYNPKTVKSLIDARKMAPQPYIINAESRCKNSKWEYPAPSMAEVWRELPEASAYLHTNKETEVWLEDEGDIIPKSESFADTNPTDALIDLLIWVRRDFNAKHDCP